LVRAETARREFGQAGGQYRYAMIVIALLTATSVSNQWQRFTIASAYQIVPQEGDQPDPKTMMQFALPDFTFAKYSLVTGPAFTLFYATSVLFTGVLADNFNRKWLLFIASISWSLMSIATAFA
jgi:MFS family permease